MNTRYILPKSLYTPCFALFCGRCKDFLCSACTEDDGDMASPSGGGGEGVSWNTGVRRGGGRGILYTGRGGCRRREGVHETVYEVGEDRRGRGGYPGGWTSRISTNGLLPLP